MLRIHEARSSSGRARQDGGAFAAATAVRPGRAMGAPRAQVQALHVFVVALGIAFQIVDDLLTMPGRSAMTTPATIFREMEADLALVIKVAASSEAEHAFLGGGRSQHQGHGGSTEALAIMARHGAMSDGRQDALAWIAKAEGRAFRFAAASASRALSDLADYVASRLTEAPDRRKRSSAGRRPQGRRCRPRRPHARRLPVARGGKRGGERDGAAGFKSSLVG